MSSLLSPLSSLRLVGTTIVCLQTPSVLPNLHPLMTRVRIRADDILKPVAQFRALNVSGRRCGLRFRQSLTLDMVFASTPASLRGTDGWCLRKGVRPGAGVWSPNCRKNGEIVSCGSQAQSESFCFTGSHWQRESFRNILGVSPCLLKATAFAAVCMFWCALCRAPWGV